MTDDEKWQKFYQSEVFRGIWFCPKNHCFYSKEKLDNDYCPECNGDGSKKAFVPVFKMMDTVYAHTTKNK